MYMGHAHLYWTVSESPEMTKFFVKERQFIDSDLNSEVSSR